MRLVLLKKDSFLRHMILARAASGKKMPSGVGELVLVVFIWNCILTLLRWTFAIFVYIPLWLLWHGAKFTLMRMLFPVTKYLALKVVEGMKGNKKGNNEKNVEASEVDTNSEKT